MAKILRGAFRSQGRYAHSLQRMGGNTDIEREASEIYDISGEITELRKSGNLREAWELAANALKNNPASPKLNQAFFWVCYARFKEINAVIVARSAVNNGKYQPNNQEARHINVLSNRIAKLEIPEDGFEWRSLLLLVQKNLHLFPDIALLLFQHRGSLFNFEDRQPYAAEKGELPSLMMKFTRGIAKCWLANELFCEKISINDLLAWFSETRRAARDTNKLWLDWDEAKCLVRDEQYERAGKILLDVLKQKPNESWAWGELGETYIKAGESDIAIALYSKAVLCAREEQFALPALKNMITALNRNGYNREASMCLKRLLKCYAKNGWKTDKISNLSGNWYDNSVDEKALDSFLKGKAEEAYEYLGGVVYKKSIISGVHKSGRRFELFFDKGNTMSAEKKLFGKVSPKVGMYFEAKCSENPPSILSLKPCEKTEMADVGEIEGELRVAEKGFGFIGDIFVPPYLIKENSDGIIFKGLKIRSYDKKKSKYGWKAIKIYQAS